MCGIAGIVRSDGRPVSRDLVEQMCRAQSHRGPDSRGIFCDGAVGLGIQRLRVIDLATGDQPIFNEDRSIAVVLNGEIYNFQELRQSLRRAGHRFASDGDTEVIVHLYEEYGPACVRHLHGMFAFALWDSRRRELLIARDRVGKKPLFYSHRPGGLSFASELPALMQDPAIPREIDHSALDSYLAYGYVPAPMSAFLGVRKLLPATLLLYRHGNVTFQTYWKLDYGRKRTNLGAAELEEEIRTSICRAVRRRMVADVPTGAFLSGGIDSSAVVAAMAEASPRPVQTFSIGFEEEQFNELPLARHVARHFGTDHHELVVRPDAAEILPTVVQHHGEPFADHSAIPCFYLARFARERVTVALNGDGGDESFAGYQRYTTNLLLAGLDGVPRPARAAADHLARLLPGDGDLRSRLSRLKRTAASWALGGEQRYIAQQSIFTAAERSALYNPEYAALLSDASADEVILEHWRADAASPLDRMLDVDVNTYLPGDLLVKMDISTMAHSLEARSPLLDHEFMELAASLPAECKARRGRRKLALRAALRGWVPDVVLDSPKRGFELPVAQWFRGELRDYAHDVLLGTSALSRGWARESEVRRLLTEHCAERRDHGRAIWTLVMLELWYQQIVRAPSAPVSMSTALT